MQTIQLRMININDYNHFLAWSMDDTFCLANGWELNRNKEEIYEWLVNIVNNDSSNFIRLGIDYNGRLVGYGDIVFIEKNIAEVGIAIGERSLWGKGIGSYALFQLMQYGSKELGITMYTAETHKPNMRSRNMLGKIGFSERSRIGSELYKGRESQLIQYEKTM